MSDANEKKGSDTELHNDSGLDNGWFIWTAETLEAATQQLGGHWIVATDTEAETDKNKENTLSEDISTDIDIHATRIISDTRKIEVGDIFLAIVGDNFDGHDFIQTAIDKGAVAVIVSREIDNIHIPQLMVKDTRLAFAQIAAYRRQQQTQLKVIAITGSSGKTTVKEMLRSIFTHATDTMTTLVTRGNLNNDYGVPMMLLELQNQHRYAVLELGANHVGEIAYTANIVKPDVACILNIGTAHLGEFGGRGNIAKTKAEIYQALSGDGTAIVPADDDYTQQLTRLASQYTDKIIHFGWQQLETAKPSRQPNIYATDIHSTALESRFNLCIDDIDFIDDIDSIDAAERDVQLAVTLPMAGKHNISNALAAAACAYTVGIDPNHIVAGLAQAKSSKGRLGRQILGIHHIIDDTYNANPNSVRAAADVLAAQHGTKILVLGDIGELGAAAAAEHTELGEAIAAKDIDMLLCVGEFAKYTVMGALNQGMQAAYGLQSKADLLAELKRVLSHKTAQNQSCTLLFKGSRTATMETLIEDLTVSFSA